MFFPVCEWVNHFLLCVPSECLQQCDHDHAFQDHPYRLSLWCHLRNLKQKEYRGVESLEVRFLEESCHLRLCDRQEYQILGSKSKYACYGKHIGRDIP